MSKRKLRELVQEGHVRGWDDPRMPTIVGDAAAGYTPEAIRDVLRAYRRRQARDTSISRCWSTAVREDLNPPAPRVMGGAPPLACGHRQLPGGPGRRRSTSSTTPRIRRPARGRCRSRASCTSSATISARIRRKILPARAGTQVRLRCAYSSPARASTKDPATGEIAGCTAPTIRPRAVVTPDGRKVKATLTGCRPRTRSSRGPAVRPAVRCGGPQRQETTGPI